MHRSSFVIFALLSLNVFARTDSDVLYFAKAKAKNSDERTRIANLGIAIDGLFSDSVTFVATSDDLRRLKRAGIKIETESLPDRLRDFPEADAEYHDYQETNQELENLVREFPKIATLFSIGKSIEGREIQGVRLSSGQEKDSLPSTVFMGCHHAREHLSVEIPLRFARYLASNYSQDARVQNLLKTREVWFVPMVNPDGAEYDIAEGKYKYWRKNRRDNGDETKGVDLNRNYGPKEFFGGPGSSAMTGSDMYHGPFEFSEPETMAVRDFLRARKKATTMITFHTFSELILWPYGHTKDNVPSAEDLKVFETMGKKMATWNGYKPEKTSDLYLASGDTTDWAYEELKLFAFTFELSPKPTGIGNFYPGPQMIETTLKANTEPMLYLLEHADNPYRVLKGQGQVDPLGIR